MRNITATILNFYLLLRLTRLSESNAEVTGHRSVGVGRDRAVAVLLRPLDQVLGTRGEALPGGLCHLHGARGDGARADADGVGRLFQHEE